MKWPVFSSSSSSSSPARFRSRQAGQSLAEFLVVMAVLLPLFLGVFYVGKYADLQQSAVQASRYAAFQRAMQPDEARLATATIEDQLRARFFTRGDGSPGNPGGELRSSDSVADAAAHRDGQVALWRDLAGNPLLSNPTQVTLAFDTQPLGAASRLVGGVDQTSFGLPHQPIQVAQVKVSLADHLREGGGAAPLRIGAATAVLGNAWNAQGSTGVREALRSNPVIRGTEGGLRLAGRVVSLAVWAIEDTEPVLPCIRVETVPSDRLSDESGHLPGACQ